MQRNLQKSKEERIALVTHCFQYEELFSELSLHSIWVIFVVWNSYKNILFDMITISAVSFVLRQFPSVWTCTSASLLAALNLYHSSFKFFLSMWILAVVWRCVECYFPCDTCALWVSSSGAGDGRKQANIALCKGEVNYLGLLQIFVEKKIL